MEGLALGYAHTYLALAGEERSVEEVSAGRLASRPRADQANDVVARRGH